MNSNVPRVSRYHIDTPSLAKSDAKVKAIWQSHSYSCASYIIPPNVTGPPGALLFDRDQRSH